MFTQQRQSFGTESDRASLATPAASSLALARRCGAACPNGSKWASVEHRAERRRRFVHQTHQALGSGCAAIAYDVPVRKTKPDGDLRRQGPTPGMTADSLWRLSCGSASAPAGSAHRSRHRPGLVMRPDLAGGSTARGELAPIGGNCPGMARAAPAIRSKGRGRRGACNRSRANAYGGARRRRAGEAPYPTGKREYFVNIAKKMQNPIDRMEDAPYRRLHQDGLARLIRCCRPGRQKWTDSHPLESIEGG